MTICWDCRQRDGSHLEDCSERIARRPVMRSRASVTFVQVHSVMSDDDVAWRREQLAARWKQ